MSIHKRILIYLYILIVLFYLWLLAHLLFSFKISKCILFWLLLALCLL